MPSNELTSRTERELFMRSFARGMTNPSNTVLRQMVDAMREGTYVAGSIIYEKGALPRNVYYVMSGRVRLATEGHEPFYFEKLSAVGALDGLQDIPHTRTAVAMEDTRCLVLSVQKWNDIIEDNHEFARNMSKSMVASVEKTGLKLPISEVHKHEIADPSALMLSVTPRRLGLLERLVVLRQAPLFNVLRSQMLVRLAETIEERALGTGEVLLEGKKRDDSIWVVASGSLEVTRIEPESKHVIGPGHAVAIFATMGDVDENYRAVATAPSRMLRLRKVDMQDALEDHPDMTRVQLAFTARARDRVQTAVANLGPLPGGTSSTPGKT